jgi:phospholipid transport system substrate-binding protein
MVSMAPSVQTRHSAILSPRQTGAHGMFLHSFAGVLFCAVVLILAALWHPTLAFADDSAMGVTKAMVNRALQILGDKQTPVVQRRRELREVLEPRFDFEEMSRSALGYHWRTLSPQQRGQFTELFTAFIEDAYLAKIQDYSGQQVEFVSDKSLGGGYSEVDTRIVQGGGNSIQVKYLLEQKGGWKIYDVAVDNISIVANYRNQFNRVINANGFDKLMTDLRAKQKELSSLTGGSR